MTRCFLAVAIVSAMIAGPAHAASVLLTFDDVACHDGTLPGPANVACSNNLPIGSDYGSTTGLSVLFAPGVRPGDPGHRGQTASQFGSSGDFGVVELGNSAPGPLSKIIFTPDAGFEVSLVSFARRRGTSTFNNANFSLLGPNGDSVYMLDVSNNPLEKVTEVVNSAFYTGPITFRYGGTQGATRIDDIRLELRAVPEPSTWAMLLGLSAAIGSTFTLGRRHRAAKAT